MTETPAPPGRPGGSLSASDRELVLTLFELSREVTGVLTLEELLPKIPQLIARLIEFQAFAVYLLDAKKRELRVAYSVGYPEEFAHSRRLKVGEGIVGTAVAEQRELVINDVHKDPRYVEAVPGSNSELVVPLRRKGATIGALNVLSRAVDQYTDRDAAILSQFGAQVAVALENAKLFDREREYSATLETLAEIGKEVAAILDLEELLARIAKLARRVIDYRTFGIMLLNETTSELEMKLAIRYGDKVDVPHIPLGAGLVGYAALHKEPVLVPDVSLDPRYIKVVDETKSELVIPLLLKDRCIGVFDLESPEVDAFHKSHVEILTLLAQPGGRRHRKRAALQGSARERAPARAGALLCAARSGCAPSDGAPRPDEGRRRRGEVRARAGAGRRLLRFPDASARQSRGRGGRRVGQGSAGSAVQRVRRGTRPIAHVPAPIRAEPGKSGAGCSAR